MNEPLRPPLPPTPPPAPGGMPPGSAQTPASGTRGREEKIVVIPDPYYAAALHMQPPFFTDDENPAAPPTPTVPTPPAPVPTVPLPPEHHSRLAIVALVLLVLIAAGGGWMYWNRTALFAPPTPIAVVVQPPALPNPPSDLTATSTAPGSVRLEWQDRAESEEGYRVERQTALDTTFIPLQTLPANSRTFLDQSAPPDTSVSYRIVAFNASGEAPSQAPITARVQALPAIPTQPTLPPDGLDLDSDGLTDVEERLYGSSGQLPDSDADGYLDGNEVFNLYSPTVAAPATLLSSNTLRAVSSTIGWETVLPRAWEIEPTASSSGFIARIPSGEVLVISMESNPDRKDIRSWLVAKRGWRNDQIYELLSNKYKVPFFLGADRLTGYIAWEDRVLVVSYQLGTQSFVNYRTTFGMILNAFRLVGSPKVPDLSSPTAIPSVFQPQTLPVVATSTLPTTTATSTSDALTTSSAMMVTSTRP